MPAWVGAGERASVTDDEAMAETGDPALETRAFRRCLGQFATGVTVMTTAIGGKPFGVTANSFASVSLDPPLVLWSIGRTSRSFAAFEQSDRFAVNFLAAGQIHVSQRFASSAEEKFEGVEWTPGQHGVPVLDGVAGYLECRCGARHDGGDHVVVIGRVERFRRYDREVLLFCQGRYGVVGEHPAQRLPVQDGPALSGPQEARLSGLIFQAHRASWMAFNSYQSEKGITFPQGLILFALWQGGGLSVQALCEQVLLPSDTVSYECRDLLSKNLIERDGDAGYSLTAEGRSIREAIRERAERYEARQLSGFTPEQIATVRSFLQAYAQSMAPAGAGSIGPHLDRRTAPD